MTEANSKVRIWLPYGNRKKLAKYFGVSIETIRKAMNYDLGNNDLHEKIRQEAIRNYGGQKIQAPVKYVG